MANYQRNAMFGAMGFGDETPYFLAAPGVPSASPTPVSAGLTSDTASWLNLGTAALNLGTGIAKAVSGGTPTGSAEWAGRRRGVGGFGGAAEWNRQPESARAAGRGRRGKGTRADQPRRKSRRAGAPCGFPPLAVFLGERGEREWGISKGEN